MTDKYLSIYLNDHLAMMVATEELVNRSLESNKGTDLATLLQTISESTAEERKAVESLMRDQGIIRNRTKTAGAWLAERVGRLKLNGEITGYSDLSRLVEIEGIDLALEGKRIFWDTLSRLGIAEVSGIETRRIARRAEQEMEQLQAHRVAAARQALALVVSTGRAGDGG